MEYTRKGHTTFRKIKRNLETFCIAGFLCTSGKRTFLVVFSVFSVTTYLLLCTTPEISHKYRRSFTCEKWKSAKQILTEFKQKPLFHLDADKLIIPWLYNGPNNQLWGLRQTVYLAMVLNRTVALPNFYKHRTDSSGPGEVIDASHRVNVDSLTSFISVISPEKFVEKCNGKLDAVFQGSSMRSWMTEDLERAESELNLTILNRNIKKRFPIPYQPQLVSTPKGVMEGEDISLLKNTFKTEAKCILYAFPFREIKLPLNRFAPQKESAIEISHIYDEVLPWQVANTLVASTCSPEYILDITSGFLEWATGGKSFLALHWRYDKEDFHRFMCLGENPQMGKGNANSNQAKMCQFVYNIVPGELGKTLVQYIQRINKEVKKKQIAFIYVAAPRQSIAEFLHHLEDTIRNNNIQVINSDDLQRYFKESRVTSYCPFVQENFNDVISMVETEVCARSMVFLRSTYSTWSENVVLNRCIVQKGMVYRRYDRPVINLMNRD